MVQRDAARRERSGMFRSTSRVSLTEVLHQSGAGG